ncbi:MAG TPA: M13 family metallopeptidase N-terminal domain-containing protein, partial [Gemmatimonadales bacterium]
MRTRLSALVLFPALLSLAAVPASAQTPAPRFPAAGRPLKVVDPQYIDSTANACTDFFQYANGGWLQHDTIPAAYSSSGVGREMGDQNELVVRAVLDDAVAQGPHQPAGSTPRKLGTFYGSCMDSTAVERAGITPIRPWLARVDAITSRAALVGAIAELHVRGTNVAFRYFPDVDAHDAAHYVASLAQGGLGLPDRDYYAKAGAAADSMRQAYLAHVTKDFTLAGEPAARAASDAAAVLALETSLAEA